jgi:hypothetical protein
MGMLDFEDTQAIEGESEAKEKVEHFILNILESFEMDLSEYIFSLYQHGRGGEEDDPVHSVEHERESNKHEDLVKASQELAEEFVDAASEDVSNFLKGKHKYVVRCENVKARCVFTLVVNQTEDDDMDDIEESPNKKGLLSMFMRHQEKIMKVAVGSVKNVIDMQHKTIKDKDERIKALETGQIETIRLTEELVSGKHMRDLELRKIDNKEKRMNEIAGMVIQGAPMLLQMVAESGKKAAASTNEEGVQVTEQPVTQSVRAEPAGSEIESLVSTLLHSFTEEQLLKIQSSGLFSPEQLLTLIQLAREVEAKKKAAASAAGASATS